MFFESFDSQNGAKKSPKTSFNLIKLSFQGLN